MFPLSAIHETPNTVLQVDDVEVDQQSERLAAELQIRDDLRLMDRCDCIDGFDLHDDEALNDQIHSIADFQSYSAIDDRKPDLSCSLKTRLLQFVLQTCLVRALQ